MVLFLFRSKLLPLLVLLGKYFLLLLLVFLIELGVTSVRGRRTIHWRQLFHVTVAVRAIGVTTAIIIICIWWSIRVTAGVAIRWWPIRIVAVRSRSIRFVDRIVVCRRTVSLVGRARTVYVAIIADSIRRRRVRGVSPSRNYSLAMKCRRLSGSRDGGCSVIH